MRDRSPSRYVVLSLAIVGIAAVAVVVWTARRPRVPTRIEVPIPEGPVASVRLPSGFTVSGSPSAPRALHAGNGTLSFSLASPPPGAPMADAIQQGKVPVGPSREVWVHGRLYKIHLAPQELFIVSKDPLVLISGSGKWSEEKVMELLDGLVTRENATTGAGTSRPQPREQAKQQDSSDAAKGRFLGSPEEPPR